MTTLNGPTVSGLKIRGFSGKEDLGAVEVLRYMPLARFLSLLELEAMWFSRLGALQDEYEGTNPRGSRAFLMRIEKENPDFTKAKTPWGGSYDELLAMADNGRSGDVGRKTLLVNCWFIGKTETQKMWRDYGDGGKGIAIRSTVKRLAASFQITEPVGSFVGKVNYVDFETYDLGPRGEDQALVSFLKDKNKFTDENEARIVTLNTFHQGTLLPDGSQPVGAGFDPEIKGLYIKCSLQGLIQSIVVGPNTDWNFHMLMKRLVARFGLTINVEHSKLPPFTGQSAEGQG
ncbi:MAG: DUF2971 domain-containing protein [Verrucomicrobiota bacterium]|jgi:hypothetical protein